MIPVTVADLVLVDPAVVVQNTVGWTVAVGGWDGDEPPAVFCDAMGDADRISGPAGW